MSQPFDVAIVGSGFAGAILARVLARSGVRVVLLERDHHPRFALGESSTPLAAIALERLAARFALPDLHDLAAFGRLVRALPGLGRGLKRGFSFYGHRPGRPIVAAERMLVAASPSEEVADVHWQRADVDAHLAHAAAAAGAELREGAEVQAAVPEDGGWRLRGPRLDLAAAFLVDATGSPGFARRALGVPPSPRPCRVKSSLVYGHFEGVAALSPPGPAGPYPDESAAVHHLLPEGWLYGLRFDSGLVSAGFELLSPRPSGWPGPAEGLFRRQLAPYPSLAQAFSRARAVRPVAAVPEATFRQARAVGPRFLMLPSAFAFTSALFSTGIAWSLRGVERAVALLAEGIPGERQLREYEDKLTREALWIERLVHGALAARGHFSTFADWTLLYFTAASFAESRERLLPEPPAGWAAEAFLGADHPHLRVALASAEAALTQTLAGRLAPESFGERLRELLAPLDVAGFSAPRADRLYPLDFEALVQNAERLGLTAEEVRAALPRLRG